MKRYFYSFILFVLIISCEDYSENIHRYSKQITQSKEYPVYLDMSEIGNIKVTDVATIVSPFKIVSNEKYYFVGEMSKGIHVYEKKTTGAEYLCFIECKFVKAFDVVNDHLFCNNFIDLVVLDVSNPIQTHMLHRQKNHFNRFTEYKEYWNIPHEDDKGCIVGYYQHSLTGIVTEKEPNLDFSEEDKLFENLTSTVIPETWVSDHPERDRPYLGIVKVGEDKIYTYGEYNSWAICTYQSGVFDVEEQDLWSTVGPYPTPYYYSNARPVGLFMKDDVLYMPGIWDNLENGYIHAALHVDEARFAYNIHHSGFLPVDATYMPEFKAFFYLSGQSILGAFRHRDPVYSTIEIYKDYQIFTDAVAIERVENYLITLGDGLTVYLPDETDIEFVKEYPDISGVCYLREGDILIVANTEGLFLYDVEDVENIERFR